MRKLVILLFSATALVGLSGCVHHSVEYRGSPHILPYDSVVIKSSPYYRTTRIHNTIIVPEGRRIHGQHHLHNKAEKHRNKTFLHNKVVKKVIHKKDIKQRVVKQRVIKKRVFREQRSIKPRRHSNYSEGRRSLKTERRIDRVKRVKRVKNFREQPHTKPMMKPVKRAKPRVIQKVRQERKSARQNFKQERRSYKENKNVRDNKSRLAKNERNTDRR